MDTLKLNDGTELAGHALETDGVMYLYIEHMSMAEGWPLLSDPEKTGRIEETRYGRTAVHTGWNHLFCMREELGGMLSAGLKRVNRR